MILRKNNQVIAEKVFFAQSWMDRARGLLGKDQPEPIYFQTRWGIHTYGMKFSIDVIVCDDEFSIRKIFFNAGPGRMLFWNPRWQNIFELPADAVKIHALQINDQLKLE